MVEVVLYFGGMAVVLIIAFCILCGCIASIEQEQNDAIASAHLGYYRAMTKKRGRK